MRRRKTDRRWIVQGFTIYWYQMDPRITVLQQVAWDKSLEALKNCPRVSNFITAKLDGSAVVFNYENEDKTQQKFCLYRSWVRNDEMVNGIGIIHCLIDCLNTLNQKATCLDFLPSVSYSIFGYGKIQNWARGKMLL